MSETPETDQQKAYTTGFYRDVTVPADFARKLERERDEAREKAERYRLEANAMMAQRDEAQRKVAELQAGLDDIEEYGTEEINAAVDLRHQLAAARVWSARWKSAAKDWRQLFRDFWRRKHVLQAVRTERDKARAALQRITESDMRWSKKIARDALEAKK